MLLPRMSTTSKVPMLPPTYWKPIKIDVVAFDYYPRDTLKTVPPRVADIMVIESLKMSMRILL